MGFEISGINELLTNLKRKGKNIESIKEKTLKAGAEPIREAMSKRAPVGVKNPQTWQYKAGKKYAVEHLKDNIIVTDMKDDAVEVGPEAHFFYGGLLEYGTVNMPAQPFAEPGFLEGKNNGLERMADVIRGEVEGV